MHAITNGWVWLGFIIFIIVALSIDTIFLSKKRANTPHIVRVALGFMLLWITLALIFCFVLWSYLRIYDPQVANETALVFLTGYLIEESLSLDNLFVFYLIFNQLRIPSRFQQRVLSIGVWSAIVFRLGLILIGSTLVREFHWLLYIMGIFLFLTGLKMLFMTSSEKSILESKLFLWLKKHIRMTDKIAGEHFFIYKNGLWYATPLFIALIFIETSDLIFALDSIPAIFAITTDPFLVWTSNIFAILGLRALYFIIAGLVERLALLKYGIALILVYVGTKMMIAPWWEVPAMISLLVISSVLIVFSLLSILITKKNYLKS